LLALQQPAHVVLLPVTLLFSLNDVVPQCALGGHVMIAGQNVVTVQLTSMPAEVQWGSEQAEPLSYNAAHRQLSYRGFMTRASYDYLRDLSKNTEYQQALLELYQMSSVALHKPHRLERSQLFLLAIGLLVFFAALAWYWYVK
jgi:hypothetical protein